MRVSIFLTYLCENRRPANTRAHESRRFSSHRDFWLSYHHFRCNLIWRIPLWNRPSFGAPSPQVTRHSHIWALHCAWSEGTACSCQPGGRASCYLIPIPNRRERGGGLRNTLARHVARLSHPSIASPNEWMGWTLKVHVHNYPNGQAIYRLPSRYGKIFHFVIWCMCISCVEDLKSPFIRRGMTRRMCNFFLLITLVMSLGIWCNVAGNMERM